MPDFESTNHAGSARANDSQSGRARRRLGQTCAVVLGLASGPAGLAPEARQLVQRASVLAGGRRQLGYFPEHPAERIVFGADLGGAIEAIRQRLDAGQDVVVLASGDPLLYGIGATLVRELGPERVAIHPAASNVQLAFAAVGEPWHDAVVLSAHGRPLGGIIPAALAATKMAVLSDAASTPAAIARALLEAGMEDCRAVVCERLPEGRLTDTRLSELPGREFDLLNVLLLFRKPADVRLRFGRPDGEFESLRGQITKAEVRAVTLSKLRLAPAGVLWDIGAGSGSVAIEAGRLIPRGQVYAVERDPEQQACLARNIRRHGATNVHIVEGEAPQALEGLPWPDSVFVGGSGGRLDELLAALPRPFVINLAVLEHVGKVLDRFPAAEVVQLSAARGAGAAQGSRLRALNPVFIVSVPK